MAEPRRLSPQEADDIASLTWGVAVYLRVTPPHKNEFMWIIFDRKTGNVLREGFDSDMTCAVFKAQEQRRKLWEENSGRTS